MQSPKRFSRNRKEDPKQTSNSYSIPKHDEARIRAQIFKLIEEADNKLQNMIGDQPPQK